MYILLLCTRYLRTRYLALACVISVMLGVATLIVVNSVMNGFSTKLRARLHSLLSDVIIETQGLEGFSDPDEKMARIDKDTFLHEHVEAMTPIMEVFALLQYTRGQRVTQTVRLVGIDPVSRDRTGAFKEHLVQGKVLPNLTFELPANLRTGASKRSGDPAKKTQGPHKSVLPQGAILGYQIAFSRNFNPQTNRLEEDLILPTGSDVTLATVGGDELLPVMRNFIVVDYFKSDVSDHDSNYVYVPLGYLQEMRNMPGRVTSIQIKLKDYSSSREVKAALKAMFHKDGLKINTWEDKQGALLAAISVEKGILNILLFLIIAVAGFGILAIFSMIVTEKTRDIGILKALGASNGGVMKIFLGYGLLLGTLGALLGSLAGIWLTVNINDVERFLTRLLGIEVFPRHVYFFSEIPTDIQPMMVFLVNLGAVAIAVAFSVLPALKAALLQPVQALRTE